MIELKSFIALINDGTLSNAPSQRVYLKSEADKVIAEKDKEIAELKAQKAQAEDDCAYWKSKAQGEM